MRLETSDISFHAEIEGDNALPLVVLLHGFAQAGSSLAELAKALRPRYRVARVDLPGHGATTLRRESELDWNTLTGSLCEAVRMLDARPAHWFGYSQGGRVALMCALVDPANIRSLALLGASAGIRDRAEREARRRSDGVLARNILRHGMEWFAENWEALPIFATQRSLPPERQELIRRERLRSTPEGLKLALECYGTGTMPDCCDALAALDVPLFLAAGEQDQKFVESNARIAAASRSRCLRHHALAGAGHAAHLEFPEPFSKLYLEFIDSVEGSDR